MINFTISTSSYMAVVKWSTKQYYLSFNFYNVPIKISISSFSIKNDKNTLQDLKSKILNKN